MSIDAPDPPKASAPDLMIVPTSSTIEATNFFSLPRELRDLIYHYLFKNVYTQIRVNECLRNLRLDRPDGGKPPPARQLKAMQASRRLWEEGSRILYRENQFHFHIGSNKFNTTLLERRITDLMQDIEIKLHPSEPAEAPEALRVLQLFGIPQILRRSCLIKLQFRKIEFMSKGVVDAVKQMTCFKVLIFEIDVPAVVMCQDLDDSPGCRSRIPWVSGLLAFIQTQLTPAMGPGTFANECCFRRLIFKPQDQKGNKTRGVGIAE